MSHESSFTYASNLHQPCHFCGKNVSVKYWVVLGPKTIVPACNKCIALRIANECK